MEKQFSEAAGSFRPIICDLAGIDPSPWLHGADVVFHLAALPGVRPSWTEFPEYLRCNVLATQRLLEACLRAQVRQVVIASSSSVYGGVAGAMSEELLPRPASPYGVTKLAAERLGLAFAGRADSETSVTALRFFTVYGPGQRSDMFISRLIHAVLSRRPITIHGDGTQRRDFVYITDIVQALLLAGFAPAARTGVINVGTGSAATVNEVLALTGELTGSPPQARYGPARPGDVEATSAALLRARERLGFRPTVGLRAGLAAQIEWTRQQLAGESPSPTAAQAPRIAPAAGG